MSTCGRFRRGDTTPESMSSVGTAATAGMRGVGLEPRWRRRDPARPRSSRVGPHIRYVHHLSLVARRRAVASVSAHTAYNQRASSAHEELLNVPSLAADGAAMVRHAERAFVARGSVAAGDPAGGHWALGADHALLDRRIVVAIPLPSLRASFLVLPREVGQLLQRLARGREPLAPLHIFRFVLDQLGEVPG